MKVPPQPPRIFPRLESQRLLRPLGYCAETAEGVGPLRKEGVVQVKGDRLQGRHVLLLADAGFPCARSRLRSGMWIRRAGSGKARCGSCPAEAARPAVRLPPPDTNAARAHPRRSPEAAPHRSGR